MIHPFRALRYDVARLGARWSDLVTQPYDKISPALKARYEAAHPNNVVRLIRGESGPEDRSWHPQAGRRLREWIDSGVLRLDEAPGYSVYRQTFRLPDGRELTRTAVTGVFEMARRDRVRHHERTHASARVDRLHLLEATEAHFGQIFLLRHRGPAFESRWLDRAGPAAELVEDDGTRHAFAPLSDPEAVAALGAIFAESEYVIADGHHRFTVAGQYAESAGHPGAGYALVTCVDLEDPGLVVLPTHRTLRGLDADRGAALDARLAAAGAKPFAGDAEALRRAVTKAGAGTVGVARPQGLFLWTIDKGAREGLDALDVVDIAEVGIEPTLAGLEEEEHLGYRRDAGAALRDVAEGRADAAFILEGIPPREVSDIAEAGGVMPPKSTDFYPKMLTGFAIYDTRVGV
ncbi:MAG: DUF1015 domain-containing protein [Planctomycetota bacterium]